MAEAFYFWQTVSEKAQWQPWGDLKRILFIDIFKSYSNQTLRSDNNKSLILAIKTRLRHVQLC